MTHAEMESELIRLNPELGQIAELPEGKPVLVSPQFGLARKDLHRRCAE